MNLYNLKRNLVSFILPNRCPFCDKLITANEFYHNACVELDLYGESGADTFYCVYNDKSKPLIARAKENADGYAISAIAKLLNKQLSKSNILQKAEIITAIPARKSSLRKRGYSLPALLAKELAGISGKRYSQNTLRLLKETKEQKDLSAVEREENLKGAFGLGKGFANGKIILIIDDVCTTGATLNEARRVLLENGAGEVYSAAFAKTI